MDHAEAVPIAEMVDERRYLLDVAYRMLGSAHEAEEVVDETYRRWYGLSDVARAGITAPRSWLTKTAREICLGRLTRPDCGDEATGTAESDKPSQASEHPGGMSQEAQIRRVLLNVLDSLSPAERAAFVLDDVVGMTPGKVADTVGRTEPSEGAELARWARHRQRLQYSRPTTPQQHDAVARAVRQACVHEDAGHLASLLSPDVTAFFDGGGKVRALVRPVHGSRQVAHSLLALLACRPRTSLTAQSVNGRTGLVVRYDDQVAAVISLGITDHHVEQVWAVLNPDKLRSWNQPANPTPDSDTTV
ncbi:sigma factor [Streptomyces brasiliensis]|uniref:RNA polymerase sigma factor n=1 Tax=Streptomyces brasiliensis TaxID=1954 RepID=A0A917KXN5_9ACTN|nr:sigma factor [Streptomyces brasiliensis]GGJ34811.1 RNA polymerase sigma factor [Streptomyces brasiliensis]